jgi:hypothetical protein
VDSWHGFLPPGDARDPVLKLSQRQQAGESCPLEVIVVGQRLFETQFPHDDKARHIGEGISLVPVFQNRLYQPIVSTNTGFIGGKSNLRPPHIQPAAQILRMFGHAVNRIIG